MAPREIIIPGSTEKHVILGNRGNKIISTNGNSGYGLDIRKANMMGRYAAKSGPIKRQASNIELAGPEIRNPLLNIVNFSLPQNYKVLNQWIRYYITFNEFIGNCIEAHGEYPISQFHYEGIDDPSVLRAYEQLKEEIDIFQVKLNMSTEYEAFGEVYPFMHWNKNDNRPDSIKILNPDYVVVNRAYLAYKNEIQIELEPDEDLRRICSSNDPRDMQLRAELDPMLVHYVMRGENIPLDQFSVAQIARRMSDYDPRGKSIILRAMKTLLYDDKLVEAQYAVADELITPRQIWKLGDPQNGYMPNQEDLQDFRQTLLDLHGDPLGALVTHYGTTLEIPSYSGKILPIVPERQYNEERILVALYTNKPVLKGEGPGFSAGPQVAFEYLQGRYMSKRHRLNKYFRDKVYIPFALANGFWKQTKDGERELILPDTVYDEKLRLVEDQGKKQFLSQMRDRLQVSWKTLAETFDLDTDKEMERLKEEQGTEVDPVAIEQRKTQSKQQPGTQQPGAKPAAEVKSTTPGFENQKEMKIDGKEPAQPKVPSEPKAAKKKLVTKRASILSSLAD